MNVLADFHHPDLWWSLHLLFEKRLGWKLYRPVGKEWFDNGYHHINDEGHGFHTAKELSYYLLDDSIKPFEGEPGMYYGEETAMGDTDYPHFRGLRLAHLRGLKIDILLCSTRCSERPAFKLQQDYFPEAKIVRQVGNQLEQVDAEICPNVLCSDLPSYKACTSPNLLFYRQEFDLEIASYQPSLGYKVISCFINHFYRDEKNSDYFQEVENILDDWRFFSYGAGCFDGKIWTKQAEVSAMWTSAFIWQTKDWDGYGFNIHRAFAVGRPVIVNKEDYVGKTAATLLEDGVTCLFLENTPEKMAEKIRHFMEPERHKKMCEFAYKRFLKVVDFDLEFRDIKKFLGRLI